MTAPGDLLTANYQFQLHQDLFGRNNNSVRIDATTPIEGLGVPEAKTQDVMLWGQDGVYANPDYESMRIITIPALIRATSEGAAFSAFYTLKTKWHIGTGSTDLAIQLPNYKFYVMGRPRAIKEDLKLQKSGVIRCLLRFDCPDPTITLVT